MDADRAKGREIRLARHVNTPYRWFEGIEGPKPAEISPKGPVLP
jgi:hypothetical protein